MELQLDNKYYDFYRFRKLEPLTNFKDIEIGVTYHIPPTIIYKRRDVIVENKIGNQIHGKVKFEDGNWEPVTLYESELSTRFLIKKQSLR